MLLKKKPTATIKDQFFPFQSKCLYFHVKELRDDVASVFFSVFPQFPITFVTRWWCVSSTVCNMYCILFLSKYVEMKNF